MLFGTSQSRDSATLYWSPTGRPVWRRACVGTARRILLSRAC